MKWLDSLRGAGRRMAGLDEQARQKMMAAWGLEDEEIAQLSPERTDEGTPLDYDRVQWLRRMAHVLDGLPETEGEWSHVVTEARAKGFDPAWTSRMMLDEFGLMARRAVSDRVLSEAERLKLEQARLLIGLSEGEAEAITQSVVAEAERFFGEHVEGN